MTEREINAFLSSTPARPGTLATTRADGRSHVAPVWFVTDDNGDIIFNTGKDTVKGRDLARTHFAALCVQDDRAPYSFVTIEGEVVLSEELGDRPQVGRHHRRPLHGSGSGRGVRGPQRGRGRARVPAPPGPGRVGGRRRKLRGGYPSVPTMPGSTTATLSSNPSPHRGPSRRRGAMREENSSADRS